MNNADKITDFLLNTMNETKSFVVEQAPDVARQMLEFGFLKAIYSAIISLVGIIAASWILKASLKSLNENDNNGDDFLLSMSILSVPLFIFSIAAFLIFIKEAVEIKIAPKAYLIEQVRGK